MVSDPKPRTLPPDIGADVGEQRSREREEPTVIIEPSGPWPRIDLRELWAYRNLFLFLVWRDIKVRYAQTVLGAGWAILQPVLAMVVFTVIFGNFAKIPSDGLRRLLNHG